MWIKGLSFNLIILMVIPLLLTAQRKALPKVLDQEKPRDFIAQHYRQLAAEASQRQAIFGDSLSWQRERILLKQQIERASGLKHFSKLPLELKETGRVKESTYIIKNIRFQTRPGIYATANLYIPHGKGPFPGVIVTHGHWPDARRSALFQSVAQVLAKSGYVAMTIDAWGTGERCTQPEVQEYHGANLGASLLNVGQSLLGMQLTDNIRAVDLLCSLAEVDATRIGATGASGGGNQTMWLAAMDERVKAAVPVVSVGTFQSYIMNSNCVCELLPQGLTFTEEAAVLGLIAPRALKIFSANQDTNPAFFPTEMLKSFDRAQAFFAMEGAEDKLSYERFDTGHGYWPVMRDALLGWFDFQLKGQGMGEARKAPEVVPLPAKRLATYPNGRRENAVMGTATFCQLQGANLHKALLQELNTADDKRKALKGIIGEMEERKLKSVEQLGEENGWRKIALITSEGQHLPLLWYPAKEKTKAYRLFIHVGGKDSIPSQAIENSIKHGENIILLDLWGTGEQASAEARKIDGKLPDFHTLSRSAIWLGRTVIGEWMADLTLINTWLQQRGDVQVNIQAYKETAVAALLFSVWYKVDELILNDCPYSCRFDDREGIDFYNMAIYLPGILTWGDITFMAALSESKINFKHARSMSGNMLTAVKKQALEKELLLLKKQFSTANEVSFTD